MAIYHASVKSFSRKSGQSSVAAAAYRAGINITCETTGTTHKYSRRRGVASHHMLAPKNAPSWCLDAKTFWSANEAAETRKNARLGRELEFSLPCELDEAQREALALAVGQMLVDRYGVVVMAAIHEPGKEGDNRNHHVHLLMSARQVGPAGLGDRAAKVLDERMGAGPNEIRALREQVAKITNEHLALAGAEDRVDHRTLMAQAEEAEAQGDFAKAIVLTRTPTTHMGKAARAIARKQDDWTRRGIFQRYTVADNRELLNDYLDRAEKEARLMDESPLHSRIAALAERQREAQARMPLDKFLGQLAQMEKEADAKPVDEDNIFRRGTGIDPFGEPEPGGIEALYAKEFEALNKAFDLEQLRPPKPEAGGDVATGDILPPPPKDADDILPPPPKDAEDIEVPAPKAAIDVFKEHAKKKPGRGRGKASTGGAGYTRLTSTRMITTRATGAGAEGLNAQAGDAQEWLANMLEASRIYLASVKQNSGVPEIQFLDAVEAMNIHRVAGYWHKPLLRQDIERLADATNTYIHATTRLSRREEAARRARDHLSEVQTEVNQLLLANPHPGRDAKRKEIKSWEKWKAELKARWEAASKAFRDAKRMLVDKAKRYYAKQTDIARTDMVDETQRIERLYPIPIPLAPEDEIYSQPFKPAPDSDRADMGHKPQGPRPKPDSSRYPKLRPPH